MKRISLKFVVGFLSFTIGILATAFWFFNPFSSYELKDINVIQNESNIDEEYAVYSVLINEKFVERNTYRTSIYIFSRTSSHLNNYLDENTFQQRVDDLHQMFHSVDEDILADFESKQTKPHDLQPKFDIPIQYRLITDQEIEKNGGRVATDFISLTPIGFNETRTQAFVGIEFNCSALCGFGSNVLLEKQNGNWRIKEDFGGWVS